MSLFARSACSLEASGFQISLILQRKTIFQIALAWPMWVGISVPKKNGEPERRSLSVCRGARGAAGPPPGGLGGWKPPRKSGGSGGRQPPSKNNFMEPESPSDHFQPPSNHLQPLQLFRKKVKPIITLPDKVFKLSG